MPSTVTCLLHALEGADCVFGEARFTSSTSSRFAKTGGAEVNSFVLSRRR
jgi:hypothetical protein